MPLNLSHPAEKQSLLAIIGVVVAVVLLLILGNFYGRFLKTQVAGPATTYSETGNLNTSTLEPGVYTLKFNGRDANGSAEASTTFEITETTIGEVTNTVVATPTPTPITVVSIPSSYTFNSSDAMVEFVNGLGIFPPMHSIGSSLGWFTADSGTALKICNLKGYAHVASQRNATLTATADNRALDENIFTWSESAQTFTIQTLDTARKLIYTGTRNLSTETDPLLLSRLTCADPIAQATSTPALLPY